MSGKFVVGLIVLISLAAGAALYYAQIYAFYQPVPASAPAAEIALDPVDGSVADAMLITAEFQGIDADSSPLRFRGCFVTPMSLPMLTESYRIYENPTPLIAPSWFSCFNAGQIDADLQSGAAVAFSAGTNIHPGVDRVVAIYPDGRAYAWNQLNSSAEE